MSDYSRDRLGPNDEDRLPWLEPVEEEPEESGIGAGKLIAGLVTALVVIGLIIGGVFWMRNRSGGMASGDGSLITAPDSYYKERPANAADESDGDEIVYSASKGNEVESVIDTSAAAEAPVNVDRPALAPALPPVPQAKPAVAAAKPAATATAPVVTTPPKAEKPAEVKAARATPPVSTPAPTSGGSIVQLGAFSSQAKANTAWKTLSSRFSFLSGLTQSVVPVQSGDKTLYRLRASGGNAGDICARLRTAGESCSVIG